MTENERKTIVTEVQMVSGEKRYRIQDDKKFHKCTIACNSSALNQGIQAGDEIFFVLNGRDELSYMKRTGNKFDLKEQPAPSNVLPANKEPVDERMFMETHRQELIHWQWCINAAIETVAMSQHPEDLDPETNELRVQQSACRYHAFIMDIIGGKP